MNDKAYDVIDRSDESIVAPSRQISYSLLTSCTDEDGSPGVICNGKCRWTGYWCSEKFSERSVYCDDSDIYDNDSTLCSNHTFWKNMNCDYSDTAKGIFYPGRRCNGSIKQCIYSTSPINYLPTTCADLSDRVFELAKPCQTTQDNLCWESCNMPGPSCTACTNTSYFQCSKSGQCIHPSLRCDGLPQCEHGEDENLNECQNYYEERKIMSGCGTHKCESKLYSNIEIYAIACNGYPECVNDEDEKSCRDQTNFYLILYINTSLIAFLYLGSKFAYIAYQKFSVAKDRRTMSLSMNKFGSIEKNVLAKYAEEHDNQIEIEKLNSFLLHMIFTKSTDETITMCKKLYAIESQVHDYNQAEIFGCLHRNLDPLIMQTVVESQFKTLTQRCTESIEKCFKKRCITEAFDYIKENEWLNIILGTTSRLIKIELQYLDIQKDTFLAVSLFIIVGGFPAIVNFPTNFSVVVVVCLFMSIVTPLFFATLHLVVKNPFLITSSTNLTKYKAGGYRHLMMVLICFLFSIANPIFLMIAYEDAKEKTRIMARSLDKNTILQMRHARAIKSLLVSFIKIELGKSAKDKDSNQNNFF